jgi:hypothetical protein
MVAGIIPGSPNALDPDRWTVTGMNTPNLIYSLWESGQGTYFLFGETGFGGVFQFLKLSAPSEFPDFTLGISVSTMRPPRQGIV